jgi:phospholipase C
MLTYDDWGGWYDHVTPPQVDANGYGFRVPTLLISPYAKQGYVDHTQLDFTSILKFIEDNYQLQPLATRDASANSFADAFDFSRSPAPAAFVSGGVAGTTSRATPRRHVIYVTYGFALLFTLLAFGSVLYLKNRPLVLPEDRWR